MGRKKTLLNFPPGNVFFVVERFVAGVSQMIAMVHQLSDMFVTTEMNVLLFQQIPKLTYVFAVVEPREKVFD